MIRIAVAADEAAIRTCVESAFARYVPLIGRKPAPMLADFAADIAAGQVFVAQDAHNVLQGVITFFPEDDHLHLDTIAVRPEAAGKGIGKALIRFCEDCARAQGLAGVHLFTNASMTDNLAIYPHLGYVEVDRRRDEGYDRVFFQKRWPVSPPPDRSF